MLHLEGGLRGTASLADCAAPRSRNRPVVSFRTQSRVRLAALAGPTDNFLMKSLVGLLVTAGLLVGIYVLYLKRMPTVAEGTAPTQAISLTGVQMDLLQIAKAEHNSVAVDGRCSSLEELISSGSMSLSRTERDGYSYSVDCSGNDFTVTARHAPAPAGSPIRYPNYAMDQSMQVRELQ